jgi:hypothetical protein
MTAVASSTPDSPVARRDRNAPSIFEVHVMKADGSARSRTNPSRPDSKFSRSD